jgi:hypothetical protein
MTKCSVFVKLVFEIFVLDVGFGSPESQKDNSML